MMCNKLSSLPVPINNATSLANFETTDHSARPPTLSVNGAKIGEVLTKVNALCVFRLDKTNEGLGIGL
jgi:hypothetical protein